VTPPAVAGAVAAPAPWRARLGRLGATVLRLVLSVAFIALALAGIGAGRVVDALSQMDVALLAAAVAVLGVSHLIASGRWWLLLRGLGLSIGRAEAVRHFFVGLFFTNVLPTGFGGDAVRGWAVAKRTSRPVEAGVSVVIDRVAAVWALVALGLLAGVAVPDAVPHVARVSIFTSSAAVALGSVVLFSERTLRVCERLLQGRSGVVDVVRRISGALRQVAARPALMACAVGLSVLSQLCVSFAAWLLARGLGIDVSPLLLTAAIPVALLATALPTTINGFGVREAVFRALLVPAGVAPATAVAFSLMTVVAGALVSLPGAVLWVVGRNAERS